MLMDTGFIPLLFTPSDNRMDPAELLWLITKYY